MDLPHALHRASPAELRERLQAERRGRPFLLFRDGDDVQRIVDLADVPDRVTIGRSPDNQIALPWDLEVSRVHAGLERLGTEWTLVDDGRSRNGSFVDGRRVHGRTRLRDGDVLSVGRTAIVFRNPTGNESLSTAISARTPHPRVTAAQQRVLTALCRPYATAPYATPASNHEIAHELVLGIETVKTHLKALFDAFAVGALPQHEKRAALARMALEQGVVSLRDLVPGGDDTARPETR